ncbi:hypothetical protein [Lysinibacillus sp. NPDC047702]|uniref:hypothetical protein n=1 Tax=unclassified Lysinibacillus TaxID=2636778 RepID=UPI003D06A287
MKLYYKTFWIGLVLMGISCIVLLLQINKQERLVAADFPIQIEQAWTFHDAHRKDERFYDLSSIFLINRIQLQDIEILQSIINNAKEAFIPNQKLRQAQDVWLYLQNGEKAYVKFGYITDEYVMLDMKTNHTYYISLENQITLWELFDGSKHNIAFWKSALFFIVYLSICLAIIIPINRLKVVSDDSPKVEKPQEQGQSFFSFSTLLAIIILPNLYGANHSLFMFTSLMLLYGISEIIYKQHQAYKNMIFGMIIILYYYLYHFYTLFV